MRGHPLVMSIHTWLVLSEIRPASAPEEVMRMVGANVVVVGVMLLHPVVDHLWQLNSLVLAVALINNIVNIYKKYFYLSLLFPFSGS